MYYSIVSSYLASYAYTALQYDNDIAGRIKSYTSNGGNKITYDYDKIDSLVEKSYEDSEGNDRETPVKYAYDALGERVAMYDSTGDTKYTYDSLGRITSATTNRTDLRDDASKSDTVTYIYDDANELSSILYPDGSAVIYEHDKNGNLTKVTDREEQVTTYVYDAINRIIEIHRPNGISTYNTYDADDHITELVNKCDECEWVVSKYSYTYNEKGYIVSEKAIESLAGYAYDSKHNGKHTDGRHDDLYPHGSKHNGKHTKDADFEYQIVETDRTFTYDDAGKLVSSTEVEDNYGTSIYTYEYDECGNRKSVTKTVNGSIAEWEKYTYNDSNELVSEKLYDGKKTTTINFTYDADGNLILELGKIGTTKVDKTYSYTVENRLEAVYDGEELLMAAAYDGDGNRVFQLNYNLHTDDDWKGNSGNGNSNNKDNKGSGGCSGDVTYCHASSSVTEEMSPRQSHLELMMLDMEMQLTQRNITARTSVESSSL